MKTVKILGTDYKVIFKDYKDDPLFEKEALTVTPMMSRKKSSFATSRPIPATRTKVPNTVPRSSDRLCDTRLSTLSYPRADCAKVRCSIAAAGRRMRKWSITSPYRCRRS